MKVRCHVAIGEKGHSFVHEFQHRPIKGDLVTYEKMLYEVQAFIQNMDKPDKLPFVVLIKKTNP